MVDIDAIIAAFLKSLDAHFANRVWFFGLQGSYARGEATPDSDVDIVVILDALSSSDIEAYYTMLSTLPHREKLCGFLSGKQELLNWAPSDLFQFYYDTKPIRGSLDALLPLIDDAAVATAIRTGICNIYHGCVHNMLYEKSEAILKGLYKSASFVVQALFFQQTGRYISRLSDLLAAASPEEQRILANFSAFKGGMPSDFNKMSADLFTWCKKMLG